jgi:hypothetical protein
LKTAKAEATQRVTAVSPIAGEADQVGETRQQKSKDQRLVGHGYAPEKIALQQSILKIETKTRLGESMRGG